MNAHFTAFVYRTRGIYMLIALVAAMILKFYLGGTTPPSLFIAGIAIMAAVQAFRMYAASYLWGRQAVTEPEADFLSTAGPYAHVRNPLYLGNFLIGIGACVAINEWYAYALFVLSYPFVYSRVIPYEERFLLGKFGQAYAEYRAQTGRIVPRLRGYRGGAKVIPDYRAGILGEIHVPVFLAVISIIIYILFVR